MRNKNRVLAVIMGGGRGTRLSPLTLERCKPAVPLAGKYRLVDIPISNCLNSDINRIVKDPEFAQRIASDGLIPAGGPPERLLTLLTEEIANWAKVAERAGLKVQ